MTGTVPRQLPGQCTVLRMYVYRQATVRQLRRCGVSLTGGVSVTNIISRESESILRARCRGADLACIGRSYVASVCRFAAALGGLSGGLRGAVLPPVAERCDSLCRCGALYGMHLRGAALRRIAYRRRVVVGAARGDIIAYPLGAAHTQQKYSLPHCGASDI